MANHLPPKDTISSIAQLLALGKPALSPPPSPLVQALLGMSKKSQPPPLSQYLISPPPSPPTLPTLGSLFGLGGPPLFNGGLAALAGTPSKPMGFGLVPAKVRRVFYSFHFKDVFRVNHIRKAGQFRSIDKERLPTPQDRSLWESVKLKNPGALMGMINRGLEGTSVTCVLAGLETWARPWVRYEIAQSLHRGNGLLAVFIHNCNCPRDGFSTKGADPLAQMAVGYDRYGQIRIYEWDSGQWRLFARLSDPLASWPKWLPKCPRGYVMPLSEGARSYDWITDNGRANLLHWTNTAAVAAGR